MTVTQIVRETVEIVERGPQGIQGAQGAQVAYQEGTFTPTAVGLSSAGTTTYAAQSGVYTKIGRVVQVRIHVAWTNMSGTGAIVIGGLPFAAVGDNPLTLRFSGLTYSGFPMAIADAGTTRIFLQQAASNGSITNIQAEPAADVMISGVYVV